MTYKILSATADGDLLITVVEYDLGGELVQVSVPHFQPASKADVAQGIANRAVSEARKRDEAARVLQIAGEIQADIMIPVELPAETSEMHGR